MHLDQQRDRQLQGIEIPAMERESNHNGRDVCPKGAPQLIVQRRIVYMLECRAKIGDRGGGLLFAPCL
eukprot:4901047-Prymnesium_polylepis.1